MQLTDRLRTRGGFCFISYKKMVMRLAVPALLIFLFASCSNHGDDSLSTSDSLSIRFMSIQSGTVIKTVGTTDKKAIRKLASFMDGQSADVNKCGFDGIISFYSKGLLVKDVSFNFSEENCRQFVQTDGDAVKATKMRNESAALLQNLAEGKTWY
jgi:hypothetical protein